MPIIDVLANRPKYLPLSIPKEYSDALKKIHGDPFTWWAGQILAYLMRFNSNFAKTVKSIRERLQFKTPCVG
jgi:glycoprotein 6-alpha-L-fucosyltransferase